MLKFVRDVSNYMQRLTTSSDHIYRCILFVSGEGFTMFYLIIKSFVHLDKLMSHSLLFSSQVSCLIFSTWILRLCISRSDGLHHFPKRYIWVQLNKVKQLEDISHNSLWIHCNDGFSADVTSAGQGLILGDSSHYF